MEQEDTAPTEEKETPAAAEGLGLGLAEGGEEVLKPPVNGEMETTEVTEGAGQGAPAAGAKKKKKKKKKKQEGAGV